MAAVDIDTKNRILGALNMVRTEVQEVNADDNILLIDGNFKFISVFAAVPTLNQNGLHVGGVLGFLKSLAYNIRQFNPTRCIIVFDGVGGSVNRRKIYPDYKGNRIVKKSINRFQEFEGLVDESQSMRQQFQRIIEYLDHLPVTVVCIDNIEGDDTIAYIAKQYYEHTENKIAIVSGDRDFLQLLNNKITVWSPTKKKLYTTDTLAAELGILPDNYLLYRALTGDTSDNIPGIKGIGLKTLLQRIPQFSDTVLDVDTLFHICEENVELAGKKKPLTIYTNILSNKLILNRNIELMQLNNVVISPRQSINIRSVMDAEIEKLNIPKFKKLFYEDLLYDSFKNVDDWLTASFRKLNMFIGK